MTLILIDQLTSPDQWWEDVVNYEQLLTNYYALLTMSMTLYIIITDQYEKHFG